MESAHTRTVAIGVKRLKIFRNLHQLDLLTLVQSKPVEAIVAAPKRKKLFLLNETAAVRVEQLKGQLTLGVGHVVSEISLFLREKLVRLDNGWLIQNKPDRREKRMVLTIMCCER